MGYEIAQNLAWEELAGLHPQSPSTVKFLADEYTVDLENKSVLSLSCNVKAKDFLAVLVLHYLIKKSKGLPALSGEWLNFRELSGIEGYLFSFKKRSLEPLIRKYGDHPEGILLALERFGGKKVEGADVAVVLEAFSGVPALIKLWRSDEEFGASANMFFDRSITGIFCTEDIVVLAGLIAGSL